MRFRAGLMVGGALLLLLALSFVISVESLHHPPDHEGDNPGKTQSLRLDHTGRREDDHVGNLGIDRPDRHHDDVRKSDGIPHVDQNGGHGTGRPHGIEDPDQKTHVTETEQHYRSVEHNGDAKTTQQLRRHVGGSSTKKIQHDKKEDTDQLDQSDDKDVTTKTKRLLHSNHLDGKSEVDRVRHARMQSRLRKSSRHGGAREIYRLDHTERQDANGKENDELHRPGRHYGGKKVERLERRDRHNGGRTTDRHAGMRKVNGLDNTDLQDGAKIKKHRHGDVRGLHRHGSIRKTDRHGGGIRVVYRHIKRTDRAAGIRKIDRRLRRSDPSGDVKQLNRQGRVRSTDHQDDVVKKTTVQESATRRNHRQGGLKKIDRQGAGRRAGCVSKTDQSGKKTDGHRGGKNVNRPSGAKKSCTVKKTFGRGTVRKSLRHGALRKTNYLRDAGKCDRQGSGIKKVDRTTGVRGLDRSTSSRKAFRLNGVKRVDRTRGNRKTHLLNGVKRIVRSTANKNNVRKVDWSTSTRSGVKRSDRSTTNTMMSHHQLNGAKRGDRFTATGNGGQKTNQSAATRNGARRVHRSISTRNGVKKDDMMRGMRKSDRLTALKKTDQRMSQGIRKADSFRSSRKIDNRNYGGARTADNRNGAEGHTRNTDNRHGKVRITDRLKNIVPQSENLRHDNNGDKKNVHRHGSSWKADQPDDLRMTDLKTDVKESDSLNGPSDSGESGKEIIEEVLKTSDEVVMNPATI